MYAVHRYNSSSVLFAYFVMNNMVIIIWRTPFPKGCPKKKKKFSYISLYEIRCNLNCLQQSKKKATYCNVFTFLKTFKYEFVVCKQSKNKYVFKFIWTLYCPHYLMCYCSNIYHVYNTNNSFVILLTQSYSLFCLQPQLF